MFASTQFARAVLNKVCRENKITIGNTYTEKTSKTEPNRRSVVFQIAATEAEKIVALSQAKQAFADAGFAQTAPKITESEYRYGYGGFTYLRVIAYLDN